MGNWIINTWKIMQNYTVPTNHSVIKTQLIIFCWSHFNWNLLLRYISCPSRPHARLKMIRVSKFSDHKSSLTLGWSRGLCVGQLICLQALEPGQPCISCIFGGVACPRGSAMHGCQGWLEEVFGLSATVEVQLGQQSRRILAIWGCWSGVN